MPKILPSEIYFEKVQQSEIGGTYFYFHNEKGVPVMILAGDWERNGRLCNFWEWRNLLTGQKEQDYGNFYELKTREE